MAYQIASIRTLRKRADGAVAYFDGAVIVDGRTVPVIIQTRKGDEAVFTTDRDEAQLSADTPAAQALVVAAVASLDAKAADAQADAAYRHKALAQVGDKLDELVAFIRDETLPLGLTDAQIAAVLPVVQAEAAVWLGLRIERATAKRPAFAKWDVAAAGWDIANDTLVRARFLRAIEASAPKPVAPKSTTAPAPAPAVPSKPVAACEMRSSGRLHIRLAYDAERIKRLRRVFPNAVFVSPTIGWKLPFDADHGAAEAFVAAEIERVAS